MSTASPVAAAAPSPLPTHSEDSIPINAPDIEGVTDRLRLLDDPQEWSAFSRPDAKREQVWESNILIEGMHCAACALTLEDALLGVPGVLTAEVSAGSHRARVFWSADAVRPSAWMRAVQAAGYRAVPANDAFARERRKNESRKALWRLLVAGLCMMQVMMYAYPAYVAEPGDLTAEMEQLLRWASWVLTLPVVLFSCGPFFSSALRDVLLRRISMDFPVALGMLITFAVSTAGTFEPLGLFGHEVYFDSLTMFVFFLLSGRWLELRLRDRTAGALEVLMNRLPDSVARLLGDGSYERVPVRRLVAGDVMRILPGETFPADGVVLQGETTVDEALLTGESRPVARGIGAAVIAGSHNLSSVVQVRVERLGDQTRFAQIVALMESASTTKPPIARLADRIAKPFLLAVLLAAGLACAFWWGRGPGHALMVAVAVLVVTCPCALSLATPAAMLAAAGTLARRGVLVRRLEAFEALAAIDTVVFDKTGTLTCDAMALGSIQTRSGVGPEQALAMAAALARHSLHTVSRALALAAGESTTGRWQAEDVRELAGAGLSGRVWADPGNGAARRVDLRLGSADFCGVAMTLTDSVHTCLSDSQGWLATFEFHEQLRSDAALTVKGLQAAGINVHLLSGDSETAAARVAVQVGITAFKGACSPQDKLDFLRHAQQKGQRVAVVGDGLNDGPVLAGAHVSFAFGQAVPLAQAQADFVVLGDQLGAVAQGLLLARRTLRIVRQNLWWAAGYNAVCVPLAMVGWMPAWLAGLGMGLSSLLVVLNALRLSDTGKGHS
ncbi:MAG: cation-translocating P-type ATPase [Gammaproteobacteria bacterium]|uniref:heavy metal translocating P-type ATPase n=1 Tax=Rhodoferax sp. TaxID=50421 RepID=UPI0017E0650E|nr:cation-translocating P-type ATPase [Rhodoferax sp.]MBU3898977.1 cation-translocating P-type ATPase [Gammaproteobacteria bacterium]MBA3056967.1 cation-translocating P-type ATPase [Rhodoferax sp.]MBU3998195.1 cation-translocating P-type ATPase [Gammaproteobacteria bacterium]MBU4018420.1 cation-translocating P-type ATPase [Gammaproteobacteria bacterium]MBU4080432.1 cation-translocating P-type ATPase [Gammaproteobacteria bacterium]